MTQKGQMVNFPGGGERYEDSGEDGLFVIAVVIKPESWRESCFVDVHTQLTLPDVCLSNVGRNLWPSDSLRAVNADHTSVSLLASVHMGSTSASLRDPTTQEYWQADYSHLTEPGRLVYRALHEGFGIEPVLLTFLDT